MSVTALEPWLDKRALAQHLGCSPRWVQSRLAEGLPSAMIAGRRKFRASEAERWLTKHGHIRRDGDAAA